MTATTATTEDPLGRAPAAKDGPSIGAAPLRSATVASRAALYALLLRDLTVLRKHLIEFVLRTVIQPFLLVFVFLYVFPEIGQTVGGRGSSANPSGLVSPRASTFRGKSAPQIPGPSIGRSSAMPGPSLTAPDLRHCSSASRRHGSR